jgi:hypothetical protein
MARKPATPTILSILYFFMIGSPYDDIAPIFRHP